MFVCFPKDRKYPEKEIDFNGIKTMRSLEYFNNNFASDQNAKQHHEAFQVLNAGPLNIRHKSQDESQHAVEMFNIC